jgi:ABC-type sugar transport system substrate-binding protein
MKKVLAIVISLLLIVSLFACTKTSTTAPSPSAAPSTTPSAAAPSTAAPSAAPSAAESASPSAASSPSAAKAEIGFYDPNFNYKAGKNYKVGYIMANTGVLYDMFSKSFQAWADRINVTYNDFACNADNDLFINTCQTYSDQGYNGLLLDPDATIYPRVSELMTELKMPWMGCMAAPYDQDGTTLLHPNVGFDNVQAGVAMAQFNVDYAKKNFTDATAANLGAIFIGYSVVPQLAQREQGYKTTFLAAFPDSSKNYYFCDGVTGDMTAQTGYNMTAATIAAHPEVKYWLISGFFDDYTDGAARAIDAAGKTATTVCSTFGGSGLIAHWDAGETNSAWRGAIFTDQRLYAMPIICGLYAMMSGQATAETLWPEWVNNSRGDKYASVLLPTVVITQDMYQSYLRWVDSYTGIVQDKYTVAPGNYSATAEVPASYNAPASPAAASPSK